MIKRAAEGLAGYLEHAGVQAGDRVLLICRTAREYIMAISPSCAR